MKKERAVLVGVGGDREVGGRTNVEKRGAGNIGGDHYKTKPPIPGFLPFLVKPFSVSPLHRGRGGGVRAMYETSLFKFY